MSLEIEYAFYLVVALAVIGTCLITYYVNQAYKLDKEFGE